MYVKDPEKLIFKMQQANPLELSDSALTKHLDTIKSITKSYIDSSNEDFKMCSPFAPFLAWASQFVIFCRHAQQQAKVENQIVSLEKSMEGQQNKKKTLQSVLEGFIQDGYIEFFKAEIEDDEARIQRYRAFLSDITDECLETQRVFLNFEKGFFSDLEQVVIQKKMTAHLKKQMPNKRW